MPTKSKRINLSIDGPMLEMLEKEAAFSRRPLATQVMIDLEKHFSEKYRELDYYRPTLLPEGERRTAPVFETKRQPEAEPLSKLHEHLGRDKS